MRLSYTKIKKYVGCGKAYELHYEQHYNQKGKSSALLFGTAIDKATEAVLKNPNIDERAIFCGNWNTQEINGKLTDLSLDPTIEYSASDFDSDLLTDEEKKTFTPEGTLDEWHDVLTNKKKERTITENELQQYNRMSWLSLRAKAFLMLQTNRNEVLPKITRVIGTQIPITLDNGAGDTLVGYADLRAEFEGVDTVLDYKTSTVPYTKDSVKRSEQLTLYAHALGLRNAGYVVLSKKLEKTVEKYCTLCGVRGEGRHKTCNANKTDGTRCGGEWRTSVSFKAPVQIITDTIPTRTEDIVLENIEQVVKGIKAQIFPRNLDRCDRPFRCEFFEVCHYNDYSKVEKAHGTS